MESRGSPIGRPGLRALPRPSAGIPLRLASLVGQDEELASLRSILENGHRLLTLTGPGGCGKTTLALEAARSLAGDFEDGAFLVELAPLSGEGLVAGEAAAALGARESPSLPPAEALAAHLGSLDLLLVLDNCEHLADECAIFAKDLLIRCQNLQILATSREPLGVPGEKVFPVPPLTWPPSKGAEGVEAISGYEAVRLFVERAEAVEPSFELGAGNAAAVAGICRELEGLPLAIELAAARTKALSAGEIVARLDDRLSLLSSGPRAAPERHRTLRAAMDWSHDVLSEAERTLFARLPVFSGSFTLEAAESVCGGVEGVEGGEVFELLFRLVERSLVVAEESNGATKYRLLRTVREYGWGKLRESGVEKEVRRSHARHFVGLAAEMEPGLKGPGQAVWVDRLDTEWDNLREAMTCMLEHGKVEPAVMLGWALWLFWRIRSRFTEGRRYMEEALALGGEPSTRAKALFIAGTMAGGQADYQAAEAMLDESLELFREAGDEAGAAHALGGAGLVALGQGRAEHAISHFDEGERLCREAGEEWLAAYLPGHAATAWLGRDEAARAKPLAERSLALARRSGEKNAIVNAIKPLSTVARAEGDHARARTLLEEGLSTAAELGNETDTAYCLESLAGVAFSEGDPAGAARLWGASESLREKAAGGGSADIARRREPGLPECRRGDAKEILGGAAFEKLRSEGKAVPPEEAVKLALEGGGEAFAAGVSRRAGVEVRALGGARVFRDGRSLDAGWKYAKSREMLYYMLMHPPRTRERIGADLWPEASASKLRGVFHTTIHHLRKTLGSKAWIRFERNLYSLDRETPDPTRRPHFDVEDFESKLGEAERRETEDPAQAIEHLREAAALYRGDLLEDIPVGEWAEPRRDELRRKHMEALLDLGRLLSLEGRRPEATDAYRQAIRRDPYSAAAHRGLILCQARLGEHAKALKHYEEFIETLRKEVGAPPDAETANLAEKLRRGEQI